ncbi:MAG: hypothetical protein IT307_11120 [Chloroflexi bacterium]|nr:hypothetical protein [Chloroflexota bacterium]
MSPRAFLDRASPYEQRSAPLDARLRWTARLSGGVMIIISLVLLVASPFLPLRPDPLILLNATGLSLCAVLGLTGGVRVGRVWRHWLAFAVAAIGSLNGLMIALPLALGALAVVGLIVFFVMRTTVVLVSSGGGLQRLLANGPPLALGVSLSLVAGPLLVVWLRKALTRRGGTASESDKISGR